VSLSTALFSVTSAALVLGLLYAGTFIFLFMERLVSARVQHREGPGRHSRTDVLQVWRDYRKTRIKADSGEPLPLRFRAALEVWRLLPAAFLLILLGGVVPSSMGGAELPLLLLLPLVAASLESLFLHATSDSRERIEWRRRLPLRIMGASVLALSFLATVLQAGVPSLGGVSSMQGSFPYHALFSSPGLFLSGIAAWGAIFLFANENPIENESELSLGNSHHYLVFFVRRLWVFCLLCFWVFVFLGGGETLAAKLLFPFKLFAALFLFLLLQNSFPRVRSTDAGELAVRWLFRLCLIGFVAEAVWVGVG
jgi:NADH:ubiquinone oxidoreductase subunit H